MVDNKSQSSSQQEENQISDSELDNDISEIFHDD